MLFRVDMSGINAAANYVKRAEVKDFLDIFFVVSRLLGEEWTVWTQHAALVYLHNDRFVMGYAGGLWERGGAWGGDWGLDRIRTTG